MAKRHTTINLDEDLIKEAQEILGADSVTETVHGALRETVRRFHLRALLERDDFPTPEELERMRAWRTFEDEPQRHAESA